MTMKPECPLCKSLEVKVLDPDYDVLPEEFDCPRCGIMKVTTLAQEDLTEKTAHYAISEIFCTRFKDGKAHTSIDQVAVAKYEKMENATDIHRQAALLLYYVKSKSFHPGNKVKVDEYYLRLLTGAIYPENMEFLMRSLQELKYITYDATDNKKEYEIMLEIRAFDLLKYLGLNRVMVPVELFTQRSLTTDNYMDQLKVMA